MNNLLRFYFFNYEILKWKANSRNRYGDYLGEIKYPSLGYKISKIMGIKKVGSRLEIYISRLFSLKLSDLTLLELVLYSTMPVAT